LDATDGRSQNDRNLPGGKPGTDVSEKHVFAE
jgi:hypothetical protein